MVSSWTSVVTDPLGIVGFVLFLVFGMLAKLKSRHERRWVSRASIVLASVALVGGLSLAYIKLKRESAAPLRSQPSQPTSSSSNQSIEVHGDNNNVVGVSGVKTEGDLTINAGQSPDKIQSRKPSQKKKP